jgi:hypothetical protein
VEADSHVLQNLSLDKWSAGLIPEPSKYEAGVVTTPLQHYVPIKWNSDIAQHYRPVTCQYGQQMHQINL